MDPVSEVKNETPSVDDARPSSVTIIASDASVYLVLMSNTAVVFTTVSVLLGLAIYLCDAVLLCASTERKERNAE